MYLPTFWKLTTEATFYRMRHMAGYTVPLAVFCKYTNPFTQLTLITLLHLYGTLTSIIVSWVIYPSLYNYYYSCISPPPRGMLVITEWK